MSVRSSVVVALIFTLCLYCAPSLTNAQEAVLYNENFDDGPGGWEPFNSHEAGIMWHHATYDGQGVAWCGADNPDYVYPPGYGNYWRQFLSKAFTLPAGNSSLSFSIQYDTELNYDYWYVEISADGGETFALLHRHSGVSEFGGFETFQFDLTSWAGQEVVVRFRFTSDATYSDADGIIDTNGACRLDWVEVAGLRDDFDTDLDGWTPTAITLNGGPYRLEADLGGNPTFAWAAYDQDGPHAGQFPWTPPEFQAANQWIRLGIESPTIIMPPHQDFYILEFDVYRDLELCEWVFYEFEVATLGPTGQWNWQSDAYIYYAPGDPPDWRTTRINLLNAVVGFDGDTPIYGPIMNPGSLMMKIRLIGREYAPQDIPFCGEHPPGPFFDNVRLLVPGGPGTVEGQVVADCPTAGSPLYGVDIFAYDTTGAQAGTAVTDATGAFDMTLESGTYTLSLVAPLGYASVPAEYTISVPPGETVSQDFSLNCLEITASPRSIGYWKHEVSHALGGRGKSNVHRVRAGKGMESEPTGDVESPLCDYLDMIRDHFNSNSVNQVVVYEEPTSGTCLDKIMAASDLLNLHGSQEMVARARQQLMALLLNAASGKIHLTEVISEDGATVSQAITYCDHLIDDPTADHESAKTIADLVNNGMPVPPGMIPLDTVQIAYRDDAPNRMPVLENVPNPFNPATTIRFGLEADGDYRVSIYDEAGRRVRDFQGRGVRGINEIVWNGRDESGRRVSSGLYIYRLDTDDRSASGKMTLLK